MKYQVVCHEAPSQTHVFSIHFFEHESEAQIWADELNQHRARPEHQWSVEPLSYQ